jgi:hypothetical protein
VTTGWKTIRPLIKEILDGVEGVGRVHDFTRHAAFWDKYLQEFIHEGIVNTWEFTRIAMPNQFDDIGSRQIVGCIFRREHMVRITGRYGLSEGAKSEHTFQDLADGVAEAFESDILLGGRLRIGSPPSIESIGHQTYGGVLVHQARILFTAAERVGNQ